MCRESVVSDTEHVQHVQLATSTVLVYIMCNSVVYIMVYCISLCVVAYRIFILKLWFTVVRVHSGRFTLVHIVNTAETTFDIQLRVTAKTLIQLPYKKYNIPYNITLNNYLDT